MAQIAPSILSADFAHLGRDVAQVIEAGATILHVDVMDGHFVPNLTIGLPVVEALRRETDVTLDVHLMISNPDEMAVAYAQAGADIVTVHIETVRHLDRLLNEIRNQGARAGVVLNPHSPVSLLEDVLPGCDLVLIMSVNPGFGGQKFIGHSLDKVRKLKDAIRQQDLAAEIEIDGGIGLDNVHEVVAAGTDILVSGSSVFGAPDPAEAFLALQRAAAGDVVEARR